METNPNGWAQVAPHGWLATRADGVEQRIGRNLVDGVEVWTLYIGARFAGKFRSFAAAAMAA